MRGNMQLLVSPVLAMNRNYLEKVILSGMRVVNKYLKFMSLR